MNNGDSILRQKDALTIINTNARSLCPKIDSLIDCFSELDVDISIITETWLKDSPQLDQDLADLEQGAGLSAILLNRAPNPTTGVSHGGVAVIYKKRIGNFKRISVSNPNNFEVLPVIGSLRGSSRKIVVIAAYLPPNYSVPRAASCIEYIEGVLIEVRRQYRDPYIVLGGDFNQWSIQDATAEFVDMREIHVGPTRGDRAIDRLFCNMSRSVTASGTVPPLETEHSKSDHLITYMTTSIARQETYEWLTYTYRVRTCLLYTSPSPRDRQKSRMPSSA